MPRGNDSEFLLQKKGADRVVQEEDLTLDEGNLKRSSEVKSESLKSPDSNGDRFTWRERFKFRNTLSRENSPQISLDLGEKNSLKVEEEVKSPKSKFPKQDSEDKRKEEKSFFRSGFFEKEKTALLKSFSRENSKDIQEPEKVKSPGIQEVKKGWKSKVGSLLKEVLEYTKARKFDDVEMEPYEGSLEIGQTDLDSFRAQDDLEESLVPVSPPQDDEDLYAISVSPVHTNSIQGSLSENEADYEIESPPKSPKRQKSVSFFLDNPSLSISAPQKSVQNEENNDDWAKRNQGTRGKVSDLILRFNEGNVKQSSSAYQSYKHEYGTARNIGRLQQTKFQ
ncbi:hypothetical protein FO519_007127 [Halicephalobus sp. NKZ332]|nr:hypothetical protein FO519_007127 [Halicephalobus sp. NKZ332]